MKLTWFAFLLLVATALTAQETENFRWARTTGRLPFMEYGPGEDRLGGAKMTYLDSLIVLKVVDSLTTAIESLLMIPSITKAGSASLRSISTTSSQEMRITAIIKEKILVGRRIMT